MPRAITVDGGGGFVEVGSAGASIDITFHTATGGGGGATNLAVTVAATTVTVTSDTGTDATIPAATTTDAGVLTAVDKSTIDGLGDSSSLDVGTTAGTVAAGDAPGAAQMAAEATAAGALSAHETDTTSVHGISDTSALVLTGDTRLSDARTPTAHKVSHENGGADEIALDASQVTSGQFSMARLATGTPDGTKFVRDDGTLVAPLAESHPVGVLVLTPTYEATSAHSAGAWISGSNYATGGMWISDGAINGYAEWSVYLGAGTWTMRCIYTTSNNGGIVTPSIAGTDLSTIDQYTASVTYNSVVSYAGISVASAGAKAVRFRAASKNGSSSGYYIRMSTFSFRRTA